MKNKYVNVDIYNDGVYLTFVCNSVNFNKREKLRFPKKMQRIVIDEIALFFLNKKIDWYYELHDADVT